MRLSIAFLIFLLSLPAIAKDFEPIVGRASVVDGDTIDIQGQRIRIWGIDAPESRQTCTDGQGASYRCGQKSALALSEWLDQSQPVICTPEYKDRYKRFVARCSRYDGQDIGSYMVKNGYALDWPHYSKGRYAPYQKEAIYKSAGVWQGTFELPWEWRHKKKRK